LTPEEQNHVRACATCGELAASAGEVEVGLFELARRADRAAAARLPSALRERVRARLTGALEQPTGTKHEQPAGAQPIATRSPAGASSDLAPQRPARVMTVAPSPRRRLRWLMAAAALAVVAFAGWRLIRPQSIGTVWFATGRMELAQSTGARRPLGIGNWEYGKGTTLTASPGASGTFGLGNHVSGALAGPAKVRLEGVDEIRLLEGSIWLNVDPKGRGLRVHSPQGDVRVTGTKFGVTVGAAETRVEVASGVVEVAQAGRQAKVSSGQRVRMTAEAIDPVAPRPQGGEPPAWVTAVNENRKKAQVGQYVPSLTEQ
jgi:hypothetical protein